MASGDRDRAADIYVGLWRQAVAQRGIDGAPTTYFVSNAMRKSRETDHAMAGRWAELVPDTELRASTMSSTYEDVWDLLYLCDALGEATPLIRQAELLKHDPERSAMWREWRLISEDATSKLMAAKRPDLAEVVRQSGAHRVANALIDAPGTVAGAAATPVLAPLIKPR